MKKILFRFFAYAIDMMVISIVLSLVSMILPFSNRSKINNYTDEYLKYTSNYSEVYTRLDEDYLSDDKLTEKEFNKISKRYDGVFDSCLKDYVGKKLSDDDKTELITNLSDKVTDEVSKYSYKITRLNIWNYVTEFVITVLYLGVIQYLLKGQTLGKKIFRLFVVDNESGENIPLWKMVLRSVLVTSIVFSIIDSIIACSTNLNSYLSINKYYSYLSTGYTLVLAMFVLFRDDQRGLHDLIIGTKVKMLNKDGSEYTYKVFNEKEALNIKEEKKDEEVKEAEFEEKTKKKTSSKKSKKKNEKDNN